MQMTFYIMDAPTASYYLNVHSYTTIYKRQMTFYVGWFNYTATECKWAFEMEKNRTLQNEKTTKSSAQLHVLYTKQPWLAFGSVAQVRSLCSYNFIPDINGIKWDANATPIQEEGREKDWWLSFFGRRLLKQQRFERCPPGADCTVQTCPKHICHQNHQNHQRIAMTAMLVVHLASPWIALRASAHPSHPCPEKSFCSRIVSSYEDDVTMVDTSLSRIWVVEKTEIKYKTYKTSKGTVFSRRFQHLWHIGRTQTRRHFYHASAEKRSHDRTSPWHVWIPSHLVAAQHSQEQSKNCPAAETHVKIFNVRLSQLEVSMWLFLSSFSLHKVWPNCSLAKAHSEWDLADWLAPRGSVGHRTLDPVAGKSHHRIAKWKCSQIRSPDCQNDPKPKMIPKWSQFERFKKYASPALKKHRRNLEETSKFRYLFDPELGTLSANHGVHPPQPGSWSQRRWSSLFARHLDLHREDHEGIPLL